MSTNTTQELPFDAPAPMTRLSTGQFIEVAELCKRWAHEKVSFTTYEALARALSSTLPYRVSVSSIATLRAQKTIDTTFLVTRQPYKKKTSLPASPNNDLDSKIANLTTDTRTSIVAIETIQRDTIGLIMQLQKQVAELEKSMTDLRERHSYLNERLTNEIYQRQMHAN